MICPKCNQTVDDSSIFCSYCGYRIDGNKSPEIKKENITTVDREIAKETVVTEQSENVEKRDETTESPVVSTLDCEVKREQLKELRKDRKAYLRTHKETSKPSENRKASLESMLSSASKRSEEHNTGKKGLVKGPGKRIR